jgi:hypothetical protein
MMVDNVVSFFAAFVAAETSMALAPCRQTWGTRESYV